MSNVLTTYREYCRQSHTQMNVDSCGSSHHGYLKDPMKYSNVHEVEIFRVDQPVMAVNTFTLHKDCVY